MRVLYDTSTVHALDRYDYYRAASGTEVAPVSVHGRAPSRLLAVMSIAQFDGFEIEKVAWSADAEIVTVRTEHLIRVCDPDYYRMFLIVKGLLRGEQAGHQVDFCARDMSLYDLSRPFHATHGTQPGELRAVMLSFPRAWVPIARSTVQPMVGTLIPRNLPGRGLIAQFLIELTENADVTIDPSLTDILRECVVGLIRAQLGQASGISPRTRQLLYVAHIRNIIRGKLADPMLNLDRIAKAASISPRYLHKIFEDVELTPMRLVKRMRLEACYRSLQDPALAATPISDVISRHGYRRSDQFARDFKQQFGITPNQVRKRKPVVVPEYDNKV